MQMANLGNVEALAYEGYGGIWLVIIYYEDGCYGAMAGIVEVLRRSHLTSRDVALGLGPSNAAGVPTLKNIKVSRQESGSRLVYVRSQISGPPRPTPHSVSPGPSSRANAPK